jgi:hypothetical protein
VDRALELHERRDVFKNVKSMTLREFKVYSKEEEDAAAPSKIRVIGNQLFVGKKLAVTLADELDPIELALINSNPRYLNPLEKKEAWKKGIEAKKIIKEACRQVKEMPEYKGIIDAQLKQAISRYAFLKGDSECLAEAVEDYEINGQNANILSIIIYNLLKARLK